MVHVFTAASLAAMVLTAVALFGAPAVAPHPAAPAVAAEVTR